MKITVNGKDVVTYIGDNYPGGINEDPCERLLRSARKVADCLYPHEDAVLALRTPKDAKGTIPEGGIDVSLGGFNVNYFADRVVEFKADLDKCEESNRIRDAFKGREK